MRFVWDKTKARNNLAKHGVSFAEATRVFEDAFAIEFLDDRQDYGEERFVIFGMVDGEVLYVAYTERDETIRMISARRATKDEEENYFKQNQ
jgi:uncharacterized DUF497 family protein